MYADQFKAYLSLFLHLFQLRTNMVGLYPPMVQLYDRILSLSILPEQLATSCNYPPPCQIDLMNGNDDL